MPKKKKPARKKQLSPQKRGWITRRKNAQARSERSKRGWITRRKKKIIGGEGKARPVEYVAHFDYGSKRARNLIRFQTHFFAPKGLPDSEVIQIIKKWERNGSLPQGWKYEIIFWGHPKAYHDRVRVKQPYKKGLGTLRRLTIRSDSGLVL